MYVRSFVEINYLFWLYCINMREATQHETVTYACLTPLFLQQLKWSQFVNCMKPVCKLEEADFVDCRKTSLAIIINWFNNFETKLMIIMFLLKHWMLLTLKKKKKNMYFIFFKTGGIKIKLIIFHTFSLQAIFF